MSAPDMHGRRAAAHRTPSRTGVAGAGDRRPPSVPSSLAPCEQLMRKPAVAGTLGIGVRTLERMLTTKEFPPPDIKRGSRLLLWRPSTVQCWIEDQTHGQGRGGVR
jgi:predicted DNA-binding transcriptional regulator AlpA